ncbi:DUF6538 domain-containing protein [Sinisalibacter aestuarii]|uniref:DUF6538 domain-containing protein n=1 Tax=Sinisalibacter aestuarii TaxID=2949426 RepID=A0ABQ5LSF4_9RHOB|nr:DUF6538 domain-containing protein [Sinisalibacter aestuarii]GKY87935.1 hypothetical protein STA1M1_18040 [Sinisalibacter aestuarii]
MKRGKGYAVRFSVPKEYQGVIGKKEIIRGLGTQDLGEAISKRDEVLQEIIGAIRSGVVPPGTELSLQPTKVHQATTVRDTAHRWLTESDGIKNSTKGRTRSSNYSEETLGVNPLESKCDW